MPTFSELDLVPSLLRAVSEQGYINPTPIQSQAIPALLEGRDVLGCAQTGTGKTAAFALPVLQKLSQSAQPAGKRRIRALILSPTRELAAQIGECFEAYARFLDIRHLVVFGGVGQNPQVRSLNAGIDVLVATPGRMLDLCNQGFIQLDAVEFFVLDEADRMLDMGFIHDIKRVLKMLPTERQNLLFSATMPRSIVQLANGFLREPIQIKVDPVSSTAERIEQRVVLVGRDHKKDLLVDVLNFEDYDRVLIFSRTKHGANRLVKILERAGIEAAAIHGNKSQNARERAMDGFRSGDLNVLIATDIASRGIDVEGVSHVINYDLPNEPESYVHRIGRTARAGASGIAISFCDETETGYLRDIERLTGLSIDVDTSFNYPGPKSKSAPAVPKPPKEARPPRRPPRNPAPGSGPSNQRRSSGPGGSAGGQRAHGPASGSSGGGGGNASRSTQRRGRPPRSS